MPPSRRSPRRAPYVVLADARRRTTATGARSRRCAASASTTATALLVFRRSRQDVRLASRRRVHRLQVRIERRRSERCTRCCSRVLARRSRVTHETIAAAMLARAVGAAQARAVERAVAAAHRSTRRLAMLGGRRPPRGSQLSLPLGDPAGELDSADEPPAWPPLLRLDDPRRGAPAARRARRRGRAERRGTNRRLRALRAPAAARRRAGDRLHRVPRHAAARAGVAGLSGRLTAARRHASRRARGRARRVRAAAGRASARHRRRRRRLNLQQSLPPRRQSRAAVESDAARAAHRPGRSHRAAPHGSRVPPDRARHAPRRASWRGFAARVATVRADIGGADPLGSLPSYRMAGSCRPRPRSRTPSARSRRGGRKRERINAMARRLVAGRRRTDARSLRVLGPADRPQPSPAHTRRAGADRGVGALAAVARRRLGPRWQRDRRWSRHQASEPHSQRATDVRESSNGRRIRVESGASRGPARVLPAARLAREQAIQRPRRRSDSARSPRSLSRVSSIAARASAAGCRHADEAAATGRARDRIDVNRRARARLCLRAATASARADPVDMLPGFAGTWSPRRFSRRCWTRSAGRRRQPRAASRLTDGGIGAARSARPRVCGPCSKRGATLSPRRSGSSRPRRSRRRAAHVAGDPVVRIDGAVALIVTSWGEPLDPLWRDAVSEAIAPTARAWCLLFNGTHLRLVDASRSFTRRYRRVRPRSDDSTIAQIVSRRSGPSITERSRCATSSRASDRHALGVCRSLRDGVLAASGGCAAALVGRDARRPRTLDDAFEQALTIVYRMLFLLFAEARALVPLWHPVYRESYSLEALRDGRRAGRRAPGLWDALRAIARLAHAGCRAGDLRVRRSTAGCSRRRGRRSPSAATWTTKRRGGRCWRSRPGRPPTARARAHRLSRPRRRAARRGLRNAARLRAARRASRRVGGDRASSCGRDPACRKATGTFYTPQPIADYLVRRTLGPLVRDATPDQILQLRVLDPAMGSGAFLVAACRFLADAYEAALVRIGRLPRRATSASRSAPAIRRTIAERCLYGVDLNPMAVQLARLSLWLATLAADRPLSFLDHHLQRGDSLLGAWLAALRRPPTAPPRRAPTARCRCSTNCTCRTRCARRCRCGSRSIDAQRHARAGAREGAGARRR